MYPENNCVPPRARIPSSGRVLRGRARVIYIVLSGYAGVLYVEIVAKPPIARTRDLYIEHCELHCVPADMSQSNL